MSYEQDANYDPKERGARVTCGQAQPSGSGGEMIEVKERLSAIDSVLRDVIVKMRGLDDFLHGNMPEDCEASDKTAESGGMMGQVFYGLDMTMKDANWICDRVCSLASQLGMRPPTKGRD